MSTNLGMVGVINNATGRYLQAHSDGETHCSQKGRFKEETWVLIEVDQTKHLYGLMNYSNQLYLSKNSNGPCAGATSTWLGPNETWTFISGVPFGFPDLVAFRAFNGKVLGANEPGDDWDECGGEVAARDVATPVAHGDWPGWWRYEAADTPTDDDGGLLGKIKIALGDIAGDMAKAAVAEILIEIATAPAA